MRDGPFVAKDYFSLSSREMLAADWFCWTVSRDLHIMRAHQPSLLHKGRVTGLVPSLRTCSRSLRYTQRSSGCCTTVRGNEVWPTWVLLSSI